MPTADFTPFFSSSFCKKYLAVYEVSGLKEIEEFKYQRETNMDDWIITDDITKIKAL